MILTPPFMFGAKSQKGITVACSYLVQYYETVGTDFMAVDRNSEQT